MRRLVLAFVLLGSFSAPEFAQAQRPVAKSAPQQHARGKSQPVTYQEAAVNDATTHPDLGAKAAGSAVLRAQILLDRAHFSVGEIDGAIGSNMDAALAGFRKKRQLPAGSGVDQAVWQALNEDTKDALITHTISAADLKGPFVKVPADMVAKAKLKHLGYGSPLEELAERFHSAPALLRTLNPKANFNRVGQKIIVPNVATPLAGQAAKVVVSKSAKTVTAFDEMGNILAQYPSSSGSDHDPLPIGEWKITGIVKNPSFHYNPDLFWDAKPDQTKQTIAPGPRNPVGVVWIDLSKEHYGIHGTPAPAAIGRQESHGCIRLTNWDALELAGLVKPGTSASLVE